MIGPVVYSADSTPADCLSLGREAPRMTVDRVVVSRRHSIDVLRLWHGVHKTCTLDSACSPPALRGTMWSMSAFEYSPNDTLH